MTCRQTDRQTDVSIVPIADHMRIAVSSMIG